MKKLLLSLIITLAATTIWAKQEKFTREINKDFSVSADAFLQITNKYGNVNIIEGNEGKIVFKIEITGKGDTDEIAKQYAEQVNIDFSASNNRVTATTRIPNMNCSNCGISVHYVVSVPRSTTMDFDLKYGNLNMNDTPKPLTVLIKYGNINAKTIADAAIDIKYGNVDFTKCKDLKLNAGYGNFKSNEISKATIDIKYGNVTFATCKDLKLNAGYGNLTADEIGNVAIDIKYGKVDIGSIKNLAINSKYTNFNIKNLENSFIASEITYGKVIIDNISTDFSKITATGKYTDFSLGLNNKHNFKAELSAYYGNINCQKISFNANVTGESKLRQLTGVAGASSNPKAEVKISTTYANITFK